LTAQQLCIIFEGRFAINLWASTKL
jgi:hypothetical protein